MTAYSFERRFVNPVRMGLGLEPLDGFPPAVGPKRHTIRAERLRGHAHPGDELQLYFGQRTKWCQRIGTSVCLCVSPLMLIFRRDRHGVIAPAFDLEAYGYHSLAAFVIADGFPDWPTMRKYWQRERKVTEFTGRIITWKTSCGPSP